MSSNQKKRGIVDVALAMATTRHLRDNLIGFKTLLIDFIQYTKYSKIPKPDFFEKILTELDKISLKYLDELYYELQAEYDNSTRRKSK